MHARTHTRKQSIVSGVRRNLQSAHTDPLALNISLTINTGVIDVKLSQSGRKGEGEKEKDRKIKEGEVEE